MLSSSADYLPCFGSIGISGTSFFASVHTAPLVVRQAFHHDAIRKLDTV
jgi:hypothetical protein